MRQQQALEELLKNRVFRNFYEISQIPRGTFHEERISNHLVEWAKERGFYCVQDSLKNVLIRKPASPGCSQSESVLLQAHMDMVCEKIPESSHDFEKDPIHWVLDGDILSTGGETTLGADDGIGMALAMAILEEEGWEHPPLEVLFTVVEEEDMSGAIGFDANSLHSTNLINLDHVNDQEILCGSCGGEAVEVHLPVSWEKMPQGWLAFSLKIHGLKGGHSGEDIHRGHGNANRLLARALMELEKQMQVKLCSLKGGSFRLAIPRDGECVVALESSCAQKAAEIIEQLQNQLKKEYESAAAQLELQLTPCETVFERVCDAADLITLVLLSPDGIQHMSADTEHVVSTSDNLGEISLEESGYRVVYEIRSAYNTARDHIADVIQRLVHMLGGTCEIFSEYPSWEYRPQSRLRAKAQEVFTEINGSSPHVYCVHAGLECGCFFEKKPDLDAISIGPDCSGLHSPQEAVSISSTKKMYEILKLLLERLA